MVEISWRPDKVAFRSSTERFTVGRQGARRKVVHAGQSFPIIVMCAIHGMAKPHERQKERSLGAKLLWRRRERTIPPGGDLPLCSAGRWES